MTASDYLKTGGKVSLGFGAMRLPGADETAKMVDAYLESGGNYFDTAYIYTGSEELLKKVLVKRHPRESYVIADKMPPWEIKTPKDRDRVFNEQLRRTGLEYFDYYLVHSLSDGAEQSTEDSEIFPYVLEQKKKGLIKHVGFSFHGTTAYLERLLKRHPEMEFVQLQLNYIDILRGPAGEWQELAIKYNKPIIVMEPIKGGSLANLPAPAEKLMKSHAPERSPASWALQYAANLKGVTCVLSGMSSLAHVKDNLQTFESLKPMTETETEILEKVMGEMSKVASIACTACKYCHSDCPLGIDIASCFSLYNELKRGAAEWNRSMMYRAIPEGKRASDCTSCGKCVSHCPQGIDIPRELVTVNKTFS